jgi:hypothetical protein
MNDEQVKFLLGASRPDGRDAADPAVAEALAAAGRDPKLRAWFGRDQAFGTAVREKMREVAPPVSLRESILAGARLKERKPWWSRPTALALAAGIALLLSLAPVAWRLARPATSASLPEFAMNFAGRGFIGLEEHGNDVEKLKAWLAQRHAPLPANIPLQLAQLRGLGCRTVNFKGKNISLVCFEGDREYHLFVARRADFPTLPGSVSPRFATQRSWASASWSDEQHHYVLVSDAGLPAVKRLL